MRTLPRGRFPFLPRGHGTRPLKAPPTTQRLSPAPPRVCDPRHGASGMCATSRTGRGARFVWRTAAARRREPYLGQQARAAADVSEREFSRPPNGPDRGAWRCNLSQRPVRDLDTRPFLENRVRVILALWRVRSESSAARPRSASCECPARSIAGRSRTAPPNSTCTCRSPMRSRPRALPSRFGRRSSQRVNRCCTGCWTPARCRSGSRSRRRV